MKKREDWKRKAIPVTLHGDKVPVIAVWKHNMKSLDSFSFQSLFASGPTIKIKLLITAIFEQNKCNMEEHGVSTMLQIWVALCWSFVAAFKGKTPKRKHVREPVRTWVCRRYPQEHVAVRWFSSPYGYPRVIWNILRRPITYRISAAMRSVRSTRQTERAYPPPSVRAEHFTR